MTKHLLLFLLLIAANPTIAFADCVFGAKDKAGFVVIDSRTIMLTGGFGPNILVKTFAFLNRNPAVVVLKDSFCSYEDAVLYIDGEVIDATQVNKLD